MKQLCKYLTNAQVWVHFLILTSCSNISLLYSIRIDQQVAEMMPQKKVPINGVKKLKVPQLVLDLYFLTRKFEFWKSFSILYYFLTFWQASFWNIISSFWNIILYKPKMSFTFFYTPYLFYSFTFSPTNMHRVVLLLVAVLARIFIQRLVSALSSYICTEW